MHDSMDPKLTPIVELCRLPALASTPQALAWHQGTLWMSSRDSRGVYGVDVRTWTVSEETSAPGIPWAAVWARDALYFTSGEGTEDDRYLRRYVPGQGFDAAFRVALPDLTGSYLSFDGQSLYVSQWYKHRLLQLDPGGNAVRTIAVGAEICGHVFVDSDLYVLRGTEQDGEHWHMARLDLREETPRAEELARVPFACRSLTFDGNHFWTNHRAANETVSFSLPDL